MTASLHGAHHANGVTLCGFYFGRFPLFPKERCRRMRARRSKYDFMLRNAFNLLHCHRSVEITVRVAQASAQVFLSIVTGKLF